MNSGRPRDTRAIQTWSVVISKNDFAKQANRTEIRLRKSQAFISQISFSDFTVEYPVTGYLKHVLKSCIKPCFERNQELFRWYFKIKHFALVRDFCFYVN